MSGGGTDTPMMRQYLELKAQVPDALLLYRMGDFYELFLDDAREAAEILELTLTSRNKSDPDPIPMAGVPHHALEPYLKRLLDAGKKVAIAEQRGEAPPAGRTLMDRELVRVVTPGVPWDASSAEPREAWFLAAWAEGRGGRVGLAFLDATTGDLRLTELPDPAGARAELERMEARELVIKGDPEAFPPELRPAGVTVSRGDRGRFDPVHAKAELCRLFGVADLGGFGVEGMPLGVMAAAAVVAYARDTARVRLPHVRRLRAYTPGGHLMLDEATRRNLELLRPLRGAGRKGTLLALLDRTATPMGGRLLREWLARPLLDLPALEERLDAVEALLPAAPRAAVRAPLRGVADLERLAGKVAQATASARDLCALAASLRALPPLAAAVGGLGGRCRPLPTDLCADVAADIDRWLIDEPPASVTEGGILRGGVHADLDALIALSTEGQGAIARIEARERARTGIQSLKVKHNKVFGYFLEVTQANFDRVPPDWIRKQTLVNAERFITPELKEFEDAVMGAEGRRRQLEYALFVALRDRVAGAVDRLQALAAAVAWVDVVQGLAELAADRRYCRPRLDDGAALHLLGARHPVVEAMDLDQPFVPNDLHLADGGRLVILTGPNMAGKSTVMRQVALCALMAQMGSFVPADAAHIGLCDRVFVRVGAADELAQGRSTFMVEMAETAAILHQATARSLVLLDEIGRGTSTYDGLAIAWAVAEDLHDRIGARAIFATHYHELTALSEDRPAVQNLHVAVIEENDQIVFLHRLRPGGVARSHGVQCARLAGVPAGVVARARALLAELERRPRHGPPHRQLGLFPPAPAPPPPTDPALITLRDAILAIDPDELSPRAAHEALRRLRGLAEGRA